MYAEYREHGPPCDPFFEDGDLVIGEFALGGHLIGFVADGVDEEAFIQFARDEGRAGFAPFEKSGEAIEVEVAFEFFRLVTVAGVAVGDEEGADLFFEEFELLGRGVFGSGYKLGAGKERQPAEGEQAEKGS